MRRLIALAPLALIACSTPQPAARVELAPAEWISFDLQGGNHVLLRGTINGHEADMLLDTGAELSVLDGAFAERIGIREGDSMHVNGVGGAKHGVRARDLVICVGNLSIEGATAVVVDLSGLGSIAARPPQVILGTEAFTQAVVDLDYPNGRVAFRSAQGFSYAGPGSTVEVRDLGRGRRAIEASIEGRAPAWFLVDTGGDQTASVSPRYAQDHGLLEGRTRASEWISMGIGGVVREQTLSVEGLTLGGFELLDVPLSVEGETSEQLEAQDVDGVLGGGVLTRFRILFDFGHGRLHLEPGPDWRTREFERNGLGLAALPEADRLRVLFVAPGSPAELAGWEAGMFVMTVDGRGGTGAELRARLKACSSAPLGTYVELHDEHGTERSLTTARYY